MMKIVTVEEEYEKNRYIQSSDIQSLIQWVQEEEHLPKITELEALIFLSGQNGNKDLTKKKIEVYYSTRKKLGDFFENRIPETLSKHFDIVLFVPLEIPRQYDRTLYCRIMDNEPSKMGITEQVKIVGMVSDLWILQEGSAPGYQFVIDATGLQFKHLLRLKINTLRNAIFVVQETLPVIVTKIHLINTSHLVEKLFQLAKPFIKSYLLEKIIFHTNGLESLYQHVPQEYLPQNLGGQGPTLEDLHRKMKQTLLENAEYFKEEETTKRTDETKRKKIESSSSWHNYFSKIKS